MHRAAVLLATVLGLAACGEASGSGAPDLGGDWQLAEGTADGAALLHPPGARATLAVGAEELRGIAFCNHYSSPYRLSGTSLTLDGIAATEMGCAPDLMAAEGAYLTALRAVDTAGLDDDGLLLTGDGVRLRFTRVTPVPDRALTGTRWVLDTLVSGQTASSTLGGPAVVELAADGGIQGSTGCRTFSGAWTARGDEVVVPDLRVDGRCPADLAAQDDHVLAVLGSGFRAQVGADRLTLTAPDGRGLVYRAGD